MELTGKRALITGGARGLGFAMAKLFTERGAKVAIADINEATLRSAAESLGPDVLAVTLDVTRPDDFHQVLESVAHSLGGLDTLVNNAGIEITKPIPDTSDDEFGRVLDVNVKGTFYGIKYATPLLAAAGGGAIVNLASVAGMGGVATQSAYCSSKAAVVRLTQVAAVELRPAGIRVNAICPGVIQTVMVDELVADLKAITGADLREATDALQGRMGTPEEIAEVAAFLVSDDASFVTGSSYIVDNGLVASTI